MTRPNARYTPLDAPGPLPWDMVRAVPSIRTDPLAFLERCVERYGDLVAFPMPRGAVLLVNDPDGARRVLQDNHRAYGKQTVQYARTVAGDRHRAPDVGRRGLAPPPPPRATGVPSRRAARRGDGRDPGGATAARGVAGRRRVRSWTSTSAAMRAMLEVVGRTLFDQDLSAVGERVVAAVDDALRVVIGQAQSPFANRLPSWVPTAARRRLARATGTLDAVCLQVVRARREQEQDGADDVLALLRRDRR